MSSIQSIQTKGSKEQNRDSKHPSKVSNDSSKVSKTVPNSSKESVNIVNPVPIESVREEKDLSIPLSPASFVAPSVTQSKSQKKSPPSSKNSPHKKIKKAGLGISERLSFKRSSFPSEAQIEALCRWERTLKIAKSVEKKPKSSKSHKKKVKVSSDLCSRCQKIQKPQKKPKKISQKVKPKVATKTIQISPNSNSNKSVKKSITSLTKSVQKSSHTVIKSFQKSTKFDLNSEKDLPDSASFPTPEQRESSIEIIEVSDRDSAEKSAKNEEEINSPILFSERLAMNNFDLLSQPKPNYVRKSATNPPMPSIMESQEFERRCGAGMKNFSHYFESNAENPSAKAIIEAVKLDPESYISVPEPSQKLFCSNLLRMLKDPLKKILNVIRLGGEKVLEVEFDGGRVIVLPEELVRLAFPALYLKFFLEKVEFQDINFG